MLTSLIANQLPEIQKILKDNSVTHAYIFGSAATGNFTDQSDIDVLVNFPSDMDPLIQGDKWWALYFALQTQLKRPIDLITESSLKNPYFRKQVENTRVSIL